MVVDLATGKVAGDIADTAGVHGIAVAPEFGRGFTSNGRTNDCTIFDLKTLAVIGQVKTGTNPDAILYDPATKRVFTFNGNSKDATAIDAAKGEVVGTIALGGRPEFADADGKGMVYANIEDTSEVVEIDAAKLAVTKRFALKPGEEPSGIAVDGEHHLVFSVCRNNMMTVLDVASGTVIATPAIGAGVDGAGYDAGTGLAFSSNGGDGTLTVVKQSAPGKFEVAETVTTQRGARTMALDPKTHLVYLPAAEYGAPTAAAAPAAAPAGAAPAAAPGARGGRGRPAMVPDSFCVLVVGK